MKLLGRWIPEEARPYLGRIVWTVLGFVIALLFLFLGFWRTILIVALTGLGYLLGTWMDGALDISRLFGRGRK